MVISMQGRMVAHRPRKLFPDAARSRIPAEELLGHVTKEMALARSPELVKLSLLFASCHNAGPILARVNGSTSESLL
jgi:hypothetical protein